VLVVDDPDFKLHNGDALDVLRTLPTESVHMACTSPPFYNLRDYGTGVWQGGDPACDHGAGKLRRPDERRSSTLLGGVAIISAQEAAAMVRWSCECGAARVDRQLGLEATPDEYVARLVEVFAEVRRVLRHDGTLWVEIGDTHASNPAVGGRGTSTLDGPPNEHTPELPWRQPAGYKPKDLMGVPWLLAFALRADGWYLRSEIVWWKPNVMPESVRDRPTVAHSRVFLLSKSPRYYFDQEAVREDFSADPEDGGGWSARYRAEQRKVLDGGDDYGRTFNPAGRNLRSVWAVTSAGYPSAHFATWPERLVEPMLLAGSPEGGWVLDPFSGAGTTAYVARRLGRRCIGIELNPDYCRLTARRTAQLSLYA
jgi:DNA modification methylase